MRTEPLDRVVAPRRLDLLGGHVAAGIVSRGVRTQSVEPGLDQRRPPAGQCPLPGLVDSVVHLGCVVAVDDHSTDSERSRLVGDRLGRGLLVERSGDGPLVVHAEEDHRSTQDAGKVARLVEVALGTGAVSEEHGDHAGFVAQRHTPCQSHGMGYLGGQRDLQRRYAYRFRETAAGGVADVVEHVPVEDLRTVTLERQRLPVLGEDPVVRRVQGMGGGGDRGLVAVDRSEGSHLPLALEVPEATGLGTGRHHVDEHRPELVIRRSRHLVDPSGGGEAGQRSQVPHVTGVRPCRRVIDR